jgi:predicted acylesterase/phospholipase RssA
MNINNLSYSQNKIDSPFPLEVSKTLEALAITAHFPLRMPQVSEEPLRLTIPAKIRPPQLTFSANGASIGIVRPAHILRKAVFQGGGVKGLCYPAFMRELGPEFLENLHEVAGTSAGAIIAFLVATGVDMDTIQSFLSDANILKLLSGNLEGHALGSGLFSAGKLIEALRSLTSREASAYYNQIKGSGQLTQIAHCHWYEQFYRRAEKQFEEGLTLNDLDLLHRLNPAKFKKLHITAFHRKTKEAVYFNSSTHPHLFGHIATRASIAIPYVFKSIVIDGQELSDGGEVTNVPLEVFSQREDFDPEETVLFVFDRGGASFQIVHRPPKIRGKSPLMKLQRMVAEIERSMQRIFPNLDIGRTGNREFSPSGTLWHGPRPSFTKRIIGGEVFVEAMRRDGEKIHSLLSNIFVIPHGQLGTINFNASKAMIDIAIKEAASAAKGYAQWRSGMASYRTYDNGKEAYASLNPDERAALIAAGLPAIAKSHLANTLQRNPSSMLMKYAPLVTAAEEIELETALEILQSSALETGKAWSWCSCPPS